MLSSMHASDTWRVFYAKDVPSPSLDNELFACLFVNLIREIYDGHENLPRLSKIRYFSSDIDPTSPFYYYNPESTKIALLEAPRKTAAHIKLHLLQSYPEGLCAFKMKSLLNEAVEMFTSHWPWETTPEEDLFYEKMLTEGWGR